MNSSLKQYFISVFLSALLLVQPAVGAIPFSFWKTPPASGFTVSSTLFDGSTNSISRATSPRSDGATGLVSIWIKEATNFDKHNLLHTASGYIELARGAGTFPTLIVYDASAVQKIGWTSTVPVFNDGNWHHILLAWDLSGPTFRAYVDDTATNTTTTLASGTAHYAATDWYIGQASGGANFLSGTLSEYYFTNEYLDISVAGNRRKFDDGSAAPGHPVNLGTTGNLPTGTSALIYLHNPYTSFGTNNGSVGGWSTNGTLAPGASTP